MFLPFCCKLTHFQIARQRICFFIVTSGPNYWGAYFHNYVSEFMKKKKPFSQSVES